MLDNRDWTEFNEEEGKKKNKSMIKRSDKLLRTYFNGDTLWTRCAELEKLDLPCLTYGLAFHLRTSYTSKTFFQLAISFLLSIIKDHSSCVS